MDDSKSNKKAVKFAVRVAQAFNIEVDIVSISNEKKVSEKNRLITKGIEGSILDKKVTYDFHRLMDNATLLKCSEFGDEIISKF